MERLYEGDAVMSWLLGGLCVVGWLGCVVLVLGLGRAAQWADQQSLRWAQEREKDEAS